MGIDIDQLGRVAHDEAASMFDPEFIRVITLPRNRTPTPDAIERLSAMLRKRPTRDDGAPNRLRPQQFQFLVDLCDLKGVFACMPVGAGKTLPTLLAATLLQSKRPWLLVPANLRKKTRRDFSALISDWRVRMPRIVSYTEMSLALNANLIELERPDLILADECDTLMRDNACSRRLRRYVDQHRPIVGACSGTLITARVLDYHGLCVQTLGQYAPLPRGAAQAERWGNALDGEIKTLVRPAAGALGRIPGGFHAWFRTSRGVVSGIGVECSASITVGAWSPPLPESLDKLVHQVEQSKIRPDGVELDDLQVADVLCQLATGFYYIWDPLPPLWWMQPRRAWYGYVRAILDEVIPGFDTPLQIVQALDHPNTSTAPPAAAEGAVLLQAWRAVEDQFEPNPVPVWIDGTVIDQIAKHAKKPATLIWTKHRAVGEMLQSHHGIPYYDGDRDPEQAPPGQCLCVSIQAHHRGKNLQHGWHRNLVLKPPSTSKTWEQLIGRTHRAGQKNSSISVEYLKTIPYHQEVVDRVLSDARKVSRASGADQKLVLADWL